MTMNMAKFEKLPDRLPPVNTVGGLPGSSKFIWLCFDTIITLLFFYLIFLYIPPFLEWAVFNANISGNDRTTVMKTDLARLDFVKVRLSSYYLGYILPKP